jgi:hypothetical protein
MVVLQGDHPWDTVMNFLTDSGNDSSRSCHSRGITAVAVGRRRITGAFSTVFSGASTEIALDLNGLFTLSWEFGPTDRDVCGPHRNSPGIQAEP